MKYDGPQKLISSDEANDANEMGNSRRTQMDPTKNAALSETKNMTRQDVILFRAPVCKSSKRRSTTKTTKNTTICETTTFTEHDVNGFASHKKL